MPPYLVHLGARFLVARRRIAAALAVVWAGVFITGCLPSPGAPAGPDPAVLQGQVDQLERRVNEQRRQIEQLQQRLETLRGFGSDREKQLIRVAEIALGRFTRSYDADGDGLDDGVVVYVVPRDSRGDPIKAAGAVAIKLLDLAAPPGRRDVTDRHWSLAQTTDHWLSGFGTNYFKFELPWPKEAPPAHDHLTVVVRFSEALTGRTFEAQKMIAAVVTPAPARR